MGILIDINFIKELADSMASSAVLFGTTAQGYDMFLSSREKLMQEIDKINDLNSTV